MDSYHAKIAAKKSSSQLIHINLPLSMYPRRRTVQEFMADKEEIQNTYFTFRKLSLGNKSNEKTKNEGPQPINASRTQLRPNIVKMARRTRGIDSPYQGDQEDEEWWRDMTGQKQGVSEQLTNISESTQIKPKLFDLQSEQLYTERVRVYHNGHLVNQKDWASYIFGEHPQQEDCNQEDEQNDALSWMDEEEHENDPESSIDDIALLLDDSDEANSLDSNYSTRTSNSIDLDDLILDQLNTELENNK